MGEERFDVLQADALKTASNTRVSISFLSERAPPSLWVIPQRLWTWIHSCPKSPENWRKSLEHSRSLVFSSQTAQRTRKERVPLNGQGSTASQKQGINLDRGI